MNEKRIDSKINQDLGSDCMSVAEIRLQGTTSVTADTLRTQTVFTGAVT